MSYITCNEGLGYEGKVTLTLKSNNRVLKAQTYKNNGTADLFKFLGSCLAGKFAEARKLLPTKILLLRNYSSTPNSADPKNVSAQSIFVGLAQIPSVVDDDTINGVKVTYNFEVPYAAISGEFNQVALYGAEKTDLNFTEFSAYYFLTNSTGEFDNQDVSTWSATTVLLVEWELSISNKNIDTETIRNAGEEA